MSYSCSNKLSAVFKPCTPTRAQQGQYQTPHNSVTMGFKTAPTVNQLNTPADTDQQRTSGLHAVWELSSVEAFDFRSSHSSSVYEWERAEPSLSNLVFNTVNVTMHVCNTNFLGESAKCSNIFMSVDGCYVWHFYMLKRCVCAQLKTCMYMKGLTSQLCRGGKLSKLTMFPYSEILDALI